LDYALFRRFDDMIQYGLPEAEQIIAVLKNRLSAFKPKQLAWSKLADKASGLSYADVARAADDTLKDAIIHDRASITDSDVLKMLEERKLISKKILIDT
jgi:AAA+ superfamily predicted ATPase